MFIQLFYEAESWSLTTSAMNLSQLCYKEVDITLLQLGKKNSLLYLGLSKDVRNIMYVNLSLRAIRRLGRKK